MNSDYALVFSKSEEDSLPVTSFTMAQSQPCMNPKETEDRGPFYPTEVARNYGECSRVNGNRLDSRYTSLGNFSVSQYYLQNEEGIIGLLSRQPMSNYYLPDITSR